MTMHKTLICLTAFTLAACSNLPKPGWYQNKTLPERVYVHFTGSEEEINAKFSGKFTKDDFVVAFARTRSSQFINEGRPKYYAVAGSSETPGGDMKIIAVETLERDYAQGK